MGWRGVRAPWQPARTGDLFAGEHLAAGDLGEDGLLAHRRLQIGGRSQASMGTGSTGTTGVGGSGGVAGEVGELPKPSWRR